MIHISKSPRTILREIKIAFEYTPGQEARARKQIEEYKKETKEKTGMENWRDCDRGWFALKYKNRSDKEILYATIANNALRDELMALDPKEDLEMKLVMAYGLPLVKTIEDTLLYGNAHEVFDNLKEVKEYYGSRLDYLTQEKLNEELRISNELEFLIKFAATVCLSSKRKDILGKELHFQIESLPFRERFEAVWDAPDIEKYRERFRETGEL